MFEAVSERKDLLHRIGRHHRVRSNDGKIDILFVGVALATSAAAAAAVIAIRNRWR